MKWKMFKMANVTLVMLFYGTVWGVHPWPPAPQFFPKLNESSPTFTDIDRKNHRDLNSFWKIYVPDKFGKIIAIHVEKMHECGYFDELSPRDFDHGHILLCMESKEEFHSIDQILSSVKMMLFHTQEKTKKWAGESARGLSPKECTPRSIIGFMNGAVCPAKDYCNEKNFAVNPYADSGTISDATIKEIFGIFRINKKEYISINGKICYPIFMLNIMPEKRGRYKVAGQKYDIYLTLVEK